MSTHDQPTPGRPFDHLDPETLPLGPEGVPGLDWPLPIDEQRQVRDVLIQEIAPVVREALGLGTPSALPVAVVSAFFVLEALTLFEAYAVTRRLGQSGMRSGRPPGEIVGRVWAGEPPATDPISSRLRSGHPRAPAWRLAGRVGRGAVSQDEFRHGPVTSRVARDRIVSTTATPFARFHAAAIGEPVTLARYETWFPPIDGGRNPGTVDPALVDALLAAVRSAFGAGSEELPAHLDGYLRRFLDEPVALVAAHLERARRKPQLIPRRVWTGTGGDLWGRLLRVLVDEFGEEITGHDHATGFGHFSTDLRAFYEFPFCSRYLVFNEVQASATRDHLRRDLLLTPSPKIETVLRGATTDEQPLSRPPTAAASGPAHRVMYVGPFYTGERQRLYPPPAYPVQVDLEARMLTTIRRAGYEVLLKPHPESVRPPHPYLRELGTIIDGPFEEVADLADVCLFISSTSTAFTNALQAGRAVVLVDTKGHLWSSNALHVLRRRCAVVIPSTGPGGRLLLPDGALEEAVAAAPTLTDDTFVRRYLPYRAT